MPDFRGTLTYCVEAPASWARSHRARVEADLAKYGLAIVDIVWMPDDLIRNVAALRCTGPDGLAVQSVDLTIPADEPERWLYPRGMYRAECRPVDLRERA